MKIHVVGNDNIKITTHLRIIHLISNYIKMRKEQATGIDLIACSLFYQITGVYELSIQKYEVFIK